MKWAWRRRLVEEPPALRDCVVVDLDSTLCNTLHRQHLIPSRSGGTWTDYSMLCTEDKVVPGVAALVWLLCKSHKIVLLTGRNDEARSLTEVWLATVGIPYHLLLMRPSADNHRHPGLWKVEQISDLASRGLRPMLVIDDMAEICEMIEDKCGVPTVCVTPPH